MSLIQSNQGPLKPLCKLMCEHKVHQDIFGELNKIQPFSPNVLIYHIHLSAKKRVGIAFILHSVRIPYQLSFYIPF